MTRTYRKCAYSKKFNGLTCVYNSFALWYAEHGDSQTARSMRRTMLRGHARSSRGKRMLHHDGEACWKRRTHGAGCCSSCTAGSWRAWKFVRGYNRVALRRGWEPMAPHWRNGAIAAWGPLPDMHS